MKAKTLRASAEAEIRARIARQRRITFAEFMEVALYHPKGGYYTRSEADGTRADYYTSPGAHPAFAGLIAVQLRSMWEALGSPQTFDVVEMGAGSGLLARDVVHYARSALGPFGEALRYTALDRSAGLVGTDRPQAAHQRLVAVGLPVKGVLGCLLSNELVDSFPVHRFQIESGAVKEVFLTIHDGELVEVIDEPSTPLLAHRLEGLALSLPDGYRGDVNLRIGPWIREAAEALDTGFALTIDYGYEAGQLYSPDRPSGTLQTYYRHTGGADLYRRIGMQDITAHVDFSAVMSEGDAAGLKPVVFCSQTWWLNRLGLDRWIQKLRTQELAQREREANMVAMRELVKPEGLGGFRVLVQEKATGIRDIDLLVPPKAPTEELPVPLLGPGHVPIMAARYPHMNIDFGELWPQGSAVGSQGPS